MSFILRRKGFYSATLGGFGEVRRIIFSLQVAGLQNPGYEA